MKTLLVLSPSAAAGKTVWIVGLVRALREANIRVGVLKPISEDSTGHKMPDGCISNSAMHLAAAAGIKPNGLINPILIRPTRSNRAEVLLFGKRIGEVSLYGRDMPVLDELGASVCAKLEDVCVSTCERLAVNIDLLVIEGAGGMNDLALLKVVDLANLGMIRHANGFVLVARASMGGALASIAGAIGLLPPEYRKQLIGFAFNDTRACLAELCATSHQIALFNQVSFLGAVPWIEWFEGRPHYAPFTAASEDDYSILAGALRSHIDLNKILAKLGLNNILETARVP